jgi:hypothetical protein
MGSILLYASCWPERRRWAVSCLAFDVQVRRFSHTKILMLDEQGARVMVAALWEMIREDRKVG